jgi:hypothetical protein
MSLWSLCYKSSCRETTTFLEVPVAYSRLEQVSYSHEFIDVILLMVAN